MEINERETCPVCNSKHELESASGYDCPKCGYRNAFVRYFAGDASYNLWQQKANRAKEQRYTLSNCFVLSSDSVAFISPDTHRLIEIFGDGRIFADKNVRQYSTCERNSALLYVDGTVKVLGDNSYRQCDVSDMEGIKYVLAAPNCTYAVNERGAVLVRGTPIDPVIKTWSDIRTIAYGSYHMLGLRNDGQVFIAGTMLDDFVVSEVEKWKDVRSIAAATDCCLALRRDGTVLFAGRKNDTRNAVDKWEEIISIAVDSSYVVGLTKKGKVKLAGNSKSFLDMGRSEAANWTDVLAISCSRSGIGAINKDGEVLLSGTMVGHIENIKKIWNEKVTI